MKRMPIRSDFASLLRRVLRLAPTSPRTLARAAGVSPALVYRAASGERTLTPAVAERLAATLDSWAADCAEAAEQLRTIGATEAGNDIQPRTRRRHGKA